MLQIDIETVKLAAQIRSEFNLKTPDAIQIATAIKGSASVFLTNDRALKKVKNIEVVTFQN